MKNTSLYLVIFSFSLFGLQAACSKRVAPVSGAIEMEKNVAHSEQPRLAQDNASNETDSPTNLFLESTEGISEEAIGEEALGTQGRKAELKEGGASAPTTPFDLGDIFFEYNMAVLKGASERALQENANKLRRHPKTRIKISGHTDERGSNEYNLALGERRARTVKQFLEAFGIAPDRIEIISYGEEKPFCKEQDEFCWKKNRRVHFSIKP